MDLWHWGMKHRKNLLDKYLSWNKEMTEFFVLGVVSMHHPLLVIPRILVDNGEYDVLR